MELLILYNTESFNKFDSSTDPVTRDSVIAHYDFNPERRYSLKSTIHMGLIDENRGLYETSEAEFYTMEMGELVENTRTEEQSSYITGTIGLSLDRVHI